jgi:hypothetical protein
VSEATAGSRTRAMVATHVSAQSHAVPASAAPAWMPPTWCTFETLHRTHSGHDGDPRPASPKRRLRTFCWRMRTAAVRFSRVRADSADSALPSPIRQSPRSRWYASTPALISTTARMSRWYGMKRGCASTRRAAAATAFGRAGVCGPDASGAAGAATSPGESASRGGHPPPALRRCCMRVTRTSPRRRARARHSRRVGQPGPAGRRVAPDRAAYGSADVLVAGAPFAAGRPD